jgi:pimeloyl-ACP methyl ester carboxylesterase
MEQEETVLSSSETVKGSKTYESDKSPITVSWKRFTPQEQSLQEPNLHKAVLFIPGYSITQDAKSIEPFCQSLAESSKSTAYAIDTRAEQVIEHSLVSEADAIRKFVVEKGLTEITLAGNSQGGAEAIHLISLLQDKHPDIKINGLVLFDAVSLNKQPPSELLRTYVTDILHTTAGLRRPLKARNTHVLVQNAKYALDGVSGILGEILKSKGDWFKRTVNEIKEMASKNTDVANVRCPVVLIQGENDIISDPKKIIPDESETDYIEKYSERGRFLQANLFTSSPFVRMVIPQKMGYHNVMYSRPEQSARVAIGLINKAQKQ